MIHRINLGNKKEALSALSKFKNKDYSPTDIELFNVHMKKLNSVLGFTLFYKNSLYLTSKLLWEAMQPVGNSGTHNYHGLEVEEIYNSLISISKATKVYKTHDDRYLIVTDVVAKCGDPIIAVIKVGSSLADIRDANINKLVTIYPKRNLELYLKRIKEK